MSDIYAAVYNGDIYKQTGGVGDFIALGQSALAWQGMAAASNGDVYACVSAGDIYKQTGGVGNFIALGQTVRSWGGMAAAPNGDVYACVYNGDIYKQTGGVGDFIALNQTLQIWHGMAAASNGDVYASVEYPGDIYKQTGGVGDFIALNQTLRDWRGMAAAPNGDVYVSDTISADIYKQTGGVGNFIALGQSALAWQGMAAASNGDVYVCVYNGDIYKQTGGVGNFIALNQTSRSWTGMATTAGELPDRSVSFDAQSNQQQFVTKTLSDSTSEAASSIVGLDFEYIKSDFDVEFIQDAYKYVLQSILDNFTPEMVRQYQDSILFKSFIEALALEIANVKFQITQAMKQLNIQQAASLFLSLWSNITGISRQNINGILETDAQYRQRLMDSIFWDKISNSTIKKSVLLRLGLGSAISDRLYAISQRPGFVNPTFPPGVDPTAKYLSNLVEISLDGAIPTDDEMNDVYDEVSSLLSAGNVVANIARSFISEFLDVDARFGTIAYGPIFMQWTNPNSDVDILGE